MSQHSRPIWQLAAYMAAIVLLGTIIAVARPSPVLSDSDLTALVNAAFIPRTEDPALHELAHQRALAASVNFSHEGMTTAEVLAYNSGFADPVSKVVDQWIASPAHAALLSDPSFTLIGCGSVTTSDGRYFAACLLSSGPVRVAAPAATDASPSGDGVGPRTTPTPPVVVIPNTSLRTP